MSALFETRPVDVDCYEGRLREYLPDEMIDAHTHVWRDSDSAHDPRTHERVVSWPSRVAEDDPIEDLVATYEIMFPGKRVTPLVFSNAGPYDDFGIKNRYAGESAARLGFPSLLYAHPTWSGEEVERKLREGGFLGVKVYLNLSPAYLPEKEIRIFDFLPPRQLDYLDRGDRVVMLHIPRDGRLGDPVNIEQMLEIERNWPHVRLIIAHVGRAYCDEDVKDAFVRLKATKNMVVDFSANTNDRVFEGALRCFGPDRCLFGSDMPITRMRMRRITEAGRYVNIVPRGLYGDVSGDKNMREVDPPESERLTFFLYEEILAIKKATERLGLGKGEVEAIFNSNAKRVLGI